MNIAARLLALFFLTAGGVATACAQDARPENWSAVKCERYSKAWREALTRLGTRGLGQEFLDRHETFLASRCEGPHDVCPRSAEELKLANIMVVRAMNAGTASTFPPFGCAN
ncbi:hypothetical protein [Terrarubrum flagellatum]|uniref:hypothetical protein n=1 Tax=Terrirubrum flagellatum TaxID=2895980 RepID=UPI0031454A98